MNFLNASSGISVTPRWAPLAQQPTLTMQPSKVVQGKPEQLLQGSPPSSPSNAASLTQLQADTASKLTGKPVAVKAERAATKSMPETVSKAGRFAKVAGHLGNAAGAAFQLYETGSEIRDIRQSADLSKTQKQQLAGESALKGVGSLSGSLGGAVAGASLGAFAGPPGLLIGAIAGGLVGDFAGSEVGAALGQTRIGSLVGRLFA